MLYLDFVNAFSAYLISTLCTLSYCYCTYIIFSAAAKTQSPPQGSFKLRLIKSKALALFSTYIFPFYSIRGLAVRENVQPLLP